MFWRVNKQLSLISSVAAVTRVRTGEDPMHCAHRCNVLSPGCQTAWPLHCMVNAKRKRAKRPLRQRGLCSFTMRGRGSRERGVNRALHPESQERRKRSCRIRARMKRQSLRPSYKEWLSTRVVCNNVNTCFQRSGFQCSDSLTNDCLTRTYLNMYKITNRLKGLAN